MLEDKLTLYDSSIKLLPSMSAWSQPPLGLGRLGLNNVWCCWYSVASFIELNPWGVFANCLNSSFSNSSSKLRHFDNSSLPKNMSEYTVISLYSDGVSYGISLHNINYFIKLLYYLADCHLWALHYMTFWNDFPLLVAFQKFPLLLQKQVLVFDLFFVEISASCDGFLFE